MNDQVLFLNQTSSRSRVAAYTLISALFVMTRKDDHGCS